MSVCQVSADVLGRVWDFCKPAAGTSFVPYPTIDPADNDAVLRDSF